MAGKGIYYVEGGAKNPEIDFNLHTGELIISGKSIPENAARIYEPVLNLIGEYIKAPRLVTNFRLNMQYFNSASMLWFARITKALSTIELEDSLLLIHIYFDLEDFDSMDPDEIREMVSSLIDHRDSTVVSIGVKIYATDDNNVIVKEATILT